MRNKTILVFFIAIFAVILTLSVVSAMCASSDSSNSSESSYCDEGFVTITSVEANSVHLHKGEHTYVGQVSDTVPVEVHFTANQDVPDRVKVKVYTEGLKDDIEETVTMRTGLKEGVEGYVARLSIKLPSSMDLDSDSESTDQDLKIFVRITSLDNDPVENEYNVNMERDLYSLNILSVDSPDQVTTGTVVPFTVVLQNNGDSRLDNVYVKASIPELGVERSVYFGDLEYNQDDSYEEIRDVTERIVYLTVPKTATPGTYNVEVEAYNYDTSTTTKKKLVVSGVDSGVLPGQNSKTIAIGEEATFDLVLVNPNDRMIVYSVTPDSAKGLTVTVDTPVVTVPAQSSKTVQVKVKATSSAVEGANLVTVNVNSESGLVKQVPFSVNVQKASTSGQTGNGNQTGNPSPTPGTTFASNGVLILTVILVIIFVVLLIVLIVLLTRKPAETEEFGETSYY